MPRKIDYIYAFITKDKDENEELMGLNIEGFNMQCCFSEARIMRLAYPRAKEVSEIAGRKLQVLKFINRVDITEDVERKI